MALKSGNCSCLDKKPVDCFCFDETVLARLSPLQKKIILELSDKPLTLCELSEKTNSSIFSLGKQLSVLQCRTKCNCLKKKGIEKPLVKKIKEQGIKTTYLLDFNH